MTDANVSRSDATADARKRMVDTQIVARGVQDPAVLRALAVVPRHAFMPENVRALAYDDSALPIGWNQTISQPYIVGLMTALLEVRPGKRILEVGTGSGYQAAILAEMGAEVYTIEIVAPLAERAQQTLADEGYDDRVRVRAGDGFAGWPEAGPFDGVIITCAVQEAPSPLLDQLAPGGVMVLPLGETLSHQTLTVVRKARDGRLTYQDITGVIFVPMTGPHGFK